jgi:D-amino-acid oxidase
VTIVAAHFPGSTSIDYTSPAAGAHWRTQSDDLFIRHCDAITYLSWLSLFSPSPSATHAEITAALSTPAALAVTTETGLALHPAVGYTELEGEDLSEVWWRDLVLDFRVLRDDELPAGCKSGVSYTTFAIDPNQYLRHLLAKCESLGAIIIRRKISSLGEVYSLPGLERVAAVVNSTGMGARELAGDRTVYPIKGQTVLVKGECKRIVFRQTKEGWQDAVLLRPGVGTILGVSKDKGDWTEGEDKATTQWILQRSAKLAPELMKDGAFKIIGVNVGRRPAREGGIRVEIERMGDKMVLHHYGHGGVGWVLRRIGLGKVGRMKLTSLRFQTSIGSAEAAVKTLLMHLSGVKSKL